MNTTIHLWLPLLTFPFFAAHVLSEEVPFTIATPKSQGLQSEILQQLPHYISTKKHDIRSVIILRNDKLIFEWYPEGISRKTNHNIFSITKTVASLLTGIAIDKGYIQNAQSTLRELLPSFFIAEQQDSKESIDLHHLLTMRSGLPVSRGNTTGAKKRLFTRIHRSPNRLALIMQELKPKKVNGSKLGASHIPMLTLKLYWARLKSRRANTLIALPSVHYSRL
jgi:CubicO group peptidase (beta-lactamase class C family)